MRGIAGYLRASAGRLPDKIALVAEGKRLSYLDLDRMSDRLAAALAARGIARGDRVVIFMDNCWEAVVAIFAVLRAGAVFSPIDPSTKADNLGFILKDCGAAGVITEPRLGSVAAKALAKAASVKLVVLAGGAHAPAAMSCLSFEDAIQGIGAAPEPASAGSEHDVAMLTYTSGSTGFPKGVKMTHRDIDAAAASFTCLENPDDDVILGVPISFDYRIYQMLMAVKLGATLVLEKSFAFPQTACRRPAEEKLSRERLAIVGREIAAKRRATSHLRQAPLLAEPVLESLT
jgi:long-chain acyl-CoA synthetase